MTKSDGKVSPSDMAIGVTIGTINVAEKQKLAGKIKGYQRFCLSIKSVNPSNIEQR